MDGRSAQIPAWQVWERLIAEVPPETLLFPDSCLLKPRREAYALGTDGLVLENEGIFPRNGRENLAWQERVAQHRPVYINPCVLEEVAAAYGFKNGLRPVHSSTVAHCHLAFLERYRLESLASIPNPERYVPDFIFSLTWRMARHMRHVTETYDSHGGPATLSETDVGLLTAAASAAMLSGQPAAVLTLDTKLRFATNAFRDVAAATSCRERLGLPPWYLRRLGEVGIFAPSPRNRYDRNGLGDAKRTS